MASKTLLHQLQSYSHRPLYPLSNHAFRYCRSVTTLTGIFNKCATESSRSGLPETDNVGLFGINELKMPDGFHILKDRVVVECNDLINQAIANSNSAQIVSIFDEISDKLCKVADLAEFTRLTHPSREFAKAAEQTSLGLGAFVEKLNTNLTLYKALKHALTDPAVLRQMDDATKHVGKLFLFDFEQSGIHLEREKRELSVRLHEAILAFGAEFSHNTAVPTVYPLSSWPSDVRIPFKITNEGHIRVSSPCSESSDSRLREEAYKAYYSPSEPQQLVLDHLLSSRNNLANLLGFDSYCHRALRGTMAANPEVVVAFLHETLDLLHDSAMEEIDVIKKWKASNCASNNQATVNMWDIRYYTSHIVSQTFNLASGKLSEYLSLGVCMEGLNILFNSLYNIQLCHQASLPGETWSPDVQKIEVRHGEEGVLGHIYCDFFSRPGKIGQDCHFTIRGGKELQDGSYQLPVVCLVCNFPSPTRSTPSLLTIGMVENLFHEMGHAMHSMLARTRYQHVTGTRCSTDFAEVPSVLMESFALDPRVLRTFAKHYRTGQPLSDDIIYKLQASKSMFSSIEMTTQAFYALVDQKYHGKHPLGKSTTGVLAELQNEFFPVPYVEGTAWQLRFSHFHSYGAKYYSYLWSKAVTALVWGRFFQDDPFSGTAGERYRRVMLAHGGGRPPQTLVDDMLGQSIQPHDLVKSLKDDLKL
eukprot:gene10869-12024_t